MVEVYASTTPPEKEVAPVGVTIDGTDTGRAKLSIRTTPRMRSLLLTCAGDNQGMGVGTGA